MVLTAPSWAASHPSYEQRGPDATTPVDSAGQRRVSLGRRSVTVVWLPAWPDSVRAHHADPGFVLTDHVVALPLDHAAPDDGHTIEVLAREVVAPSSTIHTDGARGRRRAQYLSPQQSFSDPRPDSRNPLDDHSPSRIASFLPAVGV